MGCAAKIGYDARRAAGPLIPKNLCQPIAFGAAWAKLGLIKKEFGVSKKPETPSTDWTSAAAIAGAAIGSAALAAALLYSSRRKEHAEKAAAKKPPAEPIETD